MKMLFIEGRMRSKIALPKVELTRLASPVALFTTVQYVSNLEKMKEDIETTGKKALLLKMKHAKYEGQILGCSVEKIKENVGSIFFVGDGLFHPIALKVKNNVPIFSYNPHSKEFFEITDKDTKYFSARNEILKNKFKMSKLIGIIVTIKYGQNNYLQVEKLRKRFPEKDFYVIVFDDVDYSQLINFNFIDMFVNTACPRIAIDDFKRFPKSVINIDELIE